MLPNSDCSLIKDEILDCSNELIEDRKTRFTFQLLRGVGIWKYIGALIFQTFVNNFSSNSFSMFHAKKKNISESFLRFLFFP